MSLRKKILFILVMFLCIHTFLYYAFYAFAERRNELVLQLKRYQNEKKIRILFLGDSHIVRSIDITRCGPHVQSLAYYGQNNIMSYYQLKYIIENGSAKPQYVILPCDIVTFAKGAADYRTNKFYYYPFIPLRDAAQLNDNYLAGIYDYIKIRLFPYTEWQYGFNLLNVNRQAKGKQRFTDLSENERNKNAENFIVNELFLRPDKSNLFYPSSISYLERTIDLCNKNGIKPVYITLPATQELLNEIYRKGAKDISDRPSVRIIRKHNIPVLNFETVFNEKEYLFFDSHHLNDSGKAVFTGQFKIKLDSLLKIY